MFHKETETRLVGASMKTIKVSSGIECAMICTNDNNCCSSTYDTNLEHCSLFLECCPDKEFSKGSQTIKKISGLNPPPKDCSELPAESCSGVYVIQPENGPSMTVFCEMGIDNGGWTTIQRRYDGTVDFYRFWDDYKTGFGNIAGEHWLGNDNLHFILRQRSYQVRFDLEDFTGNTSYAVYSTMYVGDESDNYKLNLTGYYGTAGDGMVSWKGGILSSDGMMFSTRDRDNDINDDKHCAIKKSGWWHGSCSYANINGGVYSEKFSKSSVH
ncbi:Angiopoietin-related protein 1,Angiopoietin-related protein 4,Ficolin-1-A,Angiopoietin-1,Fibrinogen C domain-containing protein 1,Ryncolin-1,Angiopoietin-related protein 7,Fibrinogen C domain-containing protein 1-B,Fibroleukin,Fibrinogen-like protein 1,Ficolin-1,Ficolin-1-B,Angiopoietin-4,Fibrinogen-like protein 1-like protein,Ryncolin-2,Tenascin-R,Fibrinogen C domain-containing protein 1-A,Microfibril-associated glycoprotein 4,Ryncolin-3,Tenascin-X,Ficolin-2,Fibrinogen alpha chain,Tenascin,Ryncolin-4 [Myt|uniref:Fibrinogen C-terminal domain-containing protein n=1 Tax=Mytilus edulis TaxID=6550 RepID=A0A8S3T4R9_MYTED|nr:Angiopoietin-related protein 1,Angiopoietin-related protein 4,Ficolin-1-A,Angiopoietin-1,Fibrinogen C domain-containing protein 1,Ryncolin-1,Angiopoietin-related protein 7,Fibrinogen C domain-containing protein 1-B,Fibroleukin,Fibrinogen-like protein 1,Ficolin-1,Ficolin-1-B,Angiopoietin-4,Fibrinogen-like protein 1-like protein,Ryncolin-2,Tenascin-R,Fibrinogen C domain-containing protein 1-A,Microfibril-associated glycoprotein 4,Ryncolin-3,Tenascin-X,Ficolin-2,Fibrinogen alpha chain,Tenascin,Rync